MAQKLTNNGLWDSSRFIGPELKAAVLQHHRELRRRTKPVLDADALMDISMAVSDSLSLQKPITLVTFDPFEDRVITGVVVKVDQLDRRIRLKDLTGMTWINFGDIVAASMGDS